MNQVIFWIIVAIVMGVIEAVTTNLATLWFAIGALAACLAAYLGAGNVAQWLIFVVLSAIMLATIWPIARKKMQGKTIKTNLDAVIGRELVVTKDIDNVLSTGNVTMDGSTWNARTDDGSNVAAGTRVNVVRIEGSKLIVHPIA